MKKPPTQGGRKSGFAAGAVCSGGRLVHIGGQRFLSWKGGMADVETKTDESAFDPVLDSVDVGFTDHKSLLTARMAPKRST